MPRDGAGVYSRPPGTDAVADTTIDSAKYNNNVADVEGDLNSPRPIVAGGTAATSADTALTNLSAEKAKQVVSNWDSTVWRAGSFYAATSATGAAPVAGHAFAGLAYYANASDFVLQAIDLTDVDSPIQYVRTQSAGVWGPWTSGGGAAVVPAGSALVGDYYFNATTTFPPGSGQVRFNNAAQTALITELFFSHLTAAGADVTAALPLTVFNGSEITIRDKDEPAKYKIFTATAAPVLSSGDFRVTATFKSGGTDLTAQRVLASTTGPAVRYDITQTLTATQKAQARANIDVLKKNYVLNGAMQVSQENGTTAGTVAGYYPVDQFQLVWSNAGTQTTQQVVSATPSGSLYRIRVTATVADAAVAAGDYCALRNAIEGYRIADLRLGSASAKTITVQFGVKAPAGTYVVAISNGGTRSYVAEYVIAAGEANTDVVKSVTIALDQTGTWAADNTLGLYVYWSLMAGSTYQTPAGSWAAGSFFGSPGQSNFMGTAGNVFELFDVGIYEGTAAPAFQVPDYTIELALCRRYFFKRFIEIITYAGSAGGAWGQWYPHPVVMRAAPTATVTGGSASNSPGAATADNLTIDGARVYVAATVAGQVLLSAAIQTGNARL